LKLKRIISSRAPGLLAALRPLAIMATATGSPGAFSFLRNFDEIEDLGHHLHLQAV
jgi:hypothetical protein